MKVQRRRRRENKTDYKLRLGLLKSEKPRLVIRKTNKYVIIQLVETREAKDIIKKGVTSKELLKQGWDKRFQGSLKSVPAAYLTGLLMAKNIGKENINKSFILDIGLAKHIPGSRIYAAAKGLIDGGLNINVNESAFPSEERINGKFLKEELKSIIKDLISKFKK